MGKTLEINLIGMPWPVNLLRCSRQTEAMEPGDELAITLNDKDVKDSLIQLLLAIPNLSFQVADADCGYTISVTKT